MPDNGYIALLVAVSAAVTWALRVVPFAVLAPMRHSAVVKYLSVHMPVGVMVMLALYTLRHAPESDARSNSAGFSSPWRSPSACTCGVGTRW